MAIRSCAVNIREKLSGMFCSYGLDGGHEIYPRMLVSNRTKEDIEKH
jgi:hypothetical protein